MTASRKKISISRELKKSVKPLNHYNNLFFPPCRYTRHIQEQTEEAKIPVGREYIVQEPSIIQR